MGSKLGTAVSCRYSVQTILINCLVGSAVVWELNIFLIYYDSISCDPHHQVLWNELSGGTSTGIRHVQLHWEIAEHNAIENS